MPRLVIVAYAPKPGQAATLDAVVARHVPTLQRLGLATARPAFVARAADGTVVEIFEWVSPASIDAAHDDLTVQAIWEEFAACCEFVPIANVAEAGRLFSEFESVT
jgi:hypothetical protein